MILPIAGGAQTVTGQINVIDGDTIDVGDTRVRLHAIDAIEVGQFCGSDASPMWHCGDWVRGEVRAQFQGRYAICTQQDRDRYNRVVAKCAVDGVDMGQALVRQGLAFAYRRYGMDYDLDEKTAAVQGKGLHRQGVQLPDAFRATQSRGRAAATLVSAPDGCVIKGNISSDGKRIYHLPGQVWYDRTSISTGDGERWFCSERQARTAGWRPARR